MCSCPCLLLTAVTITLLTFAQANNSPTFIDFTLTLIEPEDTPNNTILTTLTATDDDGPQELYFSIPSFHPTAQIVALVNPRGSSLTGRMVDVVLIAELDRDYSQKSRKLRFMVEDNHGGSTEGNVIQQEMTLYIRDVNDEPPTFDQSRYEVNVLENATKGSVVVKVATSDPDQGDTSEYSLEGQAVSDDYQNAFVIDRTTGEVKVNLPLDANIYNYYEYQINAMDNANHPAEPAVLLIKIQDVQDKPPYFTNLPYSKTIQEDVALGQQVLQVTAWDGDKGVPNQVKYSFISQTDNFDLDPNTGWITVKTTLDRDDPDVRQKGGVYDLTVMAKENDTTQPDDRITATTLVTITVEDINDNAPHFNSPTYEATIPENMQQGVPITFNGPGSITFMNASDIDQGANSHFELLLEKDGKPYNDFAPLPIEIYSESSILIRVQNKTALDYEKVTDVTFQIIAREISTAERRSGNATITVHIEDMNDNSPVFHPPTYPPQNVSEDSKVGSEIVALNATDLDRGNNGKITYSIRGSNSKFSIDSNTGRITLISELDREAVDNYFISVEARDGGGLTTFLNLVVIVTDVNDMSPQFRREEYYVTVAEDSRTFLRGNLVVEATDDDEPDTPNSQVHYRIVGASAGLQDKFSVDQDSGEVTMIDLIDYEALPASLDGRVVLIVEAYDQGVPERATSINITVEIEDVNDNAPIFNQTIYTATVSESALSESSILRVNATDSDSTSPNKEFLYRIDSGAGDKFRINFQTGDITVEVGAKLNREDKDSYTLNVSATDRGATPQTGNCIVQISVTDVNDEPPFFDQPVFTTSVRENESVGTNLTCTPASDLDLNPALHYSLDAGSTQGIDEEGNKVNVTSSGVQNYFQIDGTTGCISVSGQLDRETAEIVVLLVEVEDTNAVPNGKKQTATATVSVTLLDYNDKAPEFLPNATYEARILEGQDSAEVLRFVTQDKDKNQKVTYAMDSNPGDHFLVDSDTGVLRVQKKLDREDKSKLSVTVVATDNGVPALSSTATVNVIVQDINDNTPSFVTYNTHYSVPEDAAVDTPIMTISANDADEGEFQHVVYSFDVSNDDNNLKIDRKTGVVSVSRKLDREIRSSYTLYVTATDNPNDPENQRTNQTKAITITVEDVNDNDPVFTNIDQNTRPSVLENAVSGYLVFTVTAEDEDIGVNAQLDYKLTANNTIQPLFSIQTVEKSIGGVPKYFGDIRVSANSDLLGMVGEMMVNVTVTDGGSPPRSAQEVLFITVEDANLHQPEFIQPKGPQAKINVLENQPLGSPVFDIIATDQDHGRNAEVEYFLEEENDWEKFQINQKNGSLTNKAELDRETQATYQIKITARDRGFPNPLASTLTLIITMIDIDDKPPEFPHPCEPYVTSIKEEQVHEQTTTMLNISKDEDDGVNAITCYYIIGGDPQVSTHFSLDQDGQLTLTQALDRESLDDAEAVINMIVLATPRCYQNIPNNLRPSVYPTTDCLLNKTLLWVQVMITDINDNPPEFKQSVLTVGVTRATGYGVAIINLMDLITDKDATMKVDFKATKIEFQETQVFNEPFRVFKNGTVATNTYFQADQYGYFLIYIQARENVTGGEPFIANATLRVSLINDDQRLKVVFRNTPDTVRSFQVTFTQRLLNVTGYRIVVDKIQTHENVYGLPEVNKTDMFIHGENVKTNETLSASELLRIIDNYAEALLGLRYDYKVLEIVPTVREVQEDNLKEVYKMALILTTIVLTLLIIAILVVFYIMRKQYKRKLKAATALAYENKGSASDLHKLEMPGTNVHAYENVNPIYLEKVILEEAGERADDDDSLDDNAVETTRPDPYGEQQMSMNFYMEDNNLNKIPQSKLGTGDAILSDAIRHHEKNKVNGVRHQNGEIENKFDNFDGLPTTEI